MEIFIPLVNSEDEIIGHQEKLSVHEEGLLHRAFSILVFNKNRELLIHRRAYGKYHSPGLWTNTCCGHPNQDESMEMAVNRRLEEEMGISCTLNFAFKFHYLAHFDNGLIENEIDHVYVGQFDDAFIVNPDEVAEWMWILPEKIKLDMEINPDNYTYWFKEIMQKHYGRLD